ncbi:MAG: bifunctional nuclease family protein [Candidatus Heimdallarchaeota archaeon]|nr:bifunctional nuclease family protein [Candidatus Heimdallarchaeota archaeon]
MEEKLSADDTELLKVIRIDVLTASPDIFSSEEEKTGKHYAEIPLLNFELENGENFLMTNIPVSIAIEIAKKLNGVESADSRLTVAELIPELCIVERVVIDSVVPYSTAYQASIEIRLEGVTETQRFQMIPSHATLLSLVAGTSIYVSNSVIATHLDDMV